MVIWFHFGGHKDLWGHNLLVGGWAGVDVFFCLSGFLITALLLDEQRMHGTLDAAGVLGAPGLPAAARAGADARRVGRRAAGVPRSTRLVRRDAVGDGTGRIVDIGPALGDVAQALLYVANWNTLAGGTEAPLGHLWSLAVEEQFYLIWPVLLVGLLALSTRWRFDWSAG